MTTNKQDRNWEANFSLLVEFKKDNGHTMVPKADKRLGRWVQNQRAAFKNGVLKKERIAKLNNVCFFWQINRIDLWLDRFYPRPPPPPPPAAPIIDETILKTRAAAAWAYALSEDSSMKKAPSMKKARVCPFVSQKQFTRRKANLKARARHGMKRATCHDVSAAILEETFEGIIDRGICQKIMEFIDQPPKDWRWLTKGVRCFCWLKRIQDRPTDHLSFNRRDMTAPHQQNKHQVDCQPSSLLLYNCIRDLIAIGY